MLTIDINTLYGFNPFEPHTLRLAVDAVKSRRHSIAQSIKKWL